MPWSLSTRAFGKNTKMHEMKNDKKNLVCGFSYSKNLANFEAFLCSIKLSPKIIFLKSANTGHHLPAKKKWGVPSQIFWPKIISKSRSTDSTTMAFLWKLCFGVHHDITLLSLQSLNYGKKKSDNNNQKKTNLKKIATTCAESRERGGKNRFEKSAEEHLF